MLALPSGTVTFLFTDIEGSTVLWERDRATMGAAVERQLAILQSLIAAHHGVLYKTVGDRTQSAFPTARQGVAAALDAQRALASESWVLPNETLHVRMALHAGVAEPRDGDYHAGCLNRLARLLDAAHGGQILVSHTVAWLVHEDLPESASLESLGEFRLRDILQAEEIFQLCHPALRADFPPLNTPGGIPNNLPVHPTPFLGREREIDEVLAMLRRPEVRLVTLTGVGGVGKTRLALRIAAEILESFPDGAYVIDLARLTDPDLIPAATASTLGLREQPGQTLVETLSEFLRERRMLLLFDNFEHLLPAATLVSDLLAAAPELKVLTTSRAHLDLQAEHEYRVETLPIPDLAVLPPPEELLHYDAVALFVARAQALRPSFTLNSSNAAAIAAIVSHLDGLPLAIELAAARVKLLPPEVLLERLDRRLSLLTGGARDLPARQRTLRDTIAWSHDLLNHGEQVLFRRLSVFVGGWTLEGVEAIAAVSADETIDALDGLAALVDQSLVDQRSLVDVAEQEPRYRMLETIREFAGERLVESGEVAPVQQAFERFLVALVEQASTGIQGPKQITWLGRLDEEHANIRSALGSALERGDGVIALSLALRLWEFWETRGYRREGREWLERSLAVARSVDAGDRAAAEFALGRLAFDLGDYDAAEVHYQKSLEARRQLGEALAEAEALSALAKIAVNRLAYDKANDLGEESLEISRQSGDRRGMASALQVLGMVAREQGQYERALKLFAESMALGQALGDTAWMARIASQLGFTHRLAGNAEQAQHVFSFSHKIHSELGDRFQLGIIANDLGHLAFDAGDLNHAINLYAEALQHFDAVGGSEALVETIEWLAVTIAEMGKTLPALRLFGAAAAARVALRLPPRLESDEERVAAGLERAMQEALGASANAALAEGRSMSLEHARDEALALAAAVTASAKADS